MNKKTFEAVSEFLETIVSDLPSRFQDLKFQSESSGYTSERSFARP